MTTENNKSPEEFKITGDWKAQSKIIQQKFSRLTDADLKLEEGREDDLLRRVQSRLNKSREEVINIIKKEQPILGK